MYIAMNHVRTVLKIVQHNALFLQQIHLSKIDITSEVFSRFRQTHPRTNILKLICIFKQKDYITQVYLKLMESLLCIHPFEVRNIYSYSESRFFFLFKKGNLS